MIIRITVGDNDFTYYIEQFCDNLRDRMFVMDEPYPERTDYGNEEEYVNAVVASFDRSHAMKETRYRLLDYRKKFVNGTYEYSEICNEVQRLWKEYAENAHLETFTPDVSIQYSLDELDENGEVVYYFSTHDMFITQ